MARTCECSYVSQSVIPHFPESTVAEFIRSLELLSRASVILFFDYFRNAEEFRADFQARPVRRKRVYFKMQLVFFKRQADDPALLGETLGFTNREGA